MLEEICAHRRALDRVVLVYIPGHRGFVANEYADAVAKAHASGPVERGITGAILQHVMTRPCVYERKEAGSGLCQRRIYQEVWEGGREWVENEMGRGRHDLLLGGGDGVWRELAAEVGKAVTRGTAAAGVHASEEAVRAIEPGQERWKRQTRGGVCGLTHGLRTGEVVGAEQSAPWQTDAMCDAGCGEPATAQHVIMARCEGMVGRDVYVERVMRHLLKLEKCTPRARPNGDEPTREMPMNQWMCP